MGRGSYTYLDPTFVVPASPSTGAVLPNGTGPSIRWLAVLSSIVVATGLLL